LYEYQHDGTTDLSRTGFICSSIDAKETT